MQAASFTLVASVELATRNLAANSRKLRDEYLPSMIDGLMTSEQRVDVEFDVTPMLTRIGCMGVLVLTTILAAGAEGQAEDQKGAADPQGITRFPDSWIVAYAPPTPVRGYEFVTGRVDRRQRDRRIDSSRRVAAELVRATYRTPTGTRYEDVIAHYQSLVDDQDGAIAFVCRGRECGRNTVWANDVFGVKYLVAPDSAQFYLAATIGDRLVAIYVVRRGNRRVYAHLDVARTEDAAEMAPAPDVAGLLSRQGFAVLPDVTPANDGALDAADLEALVVHAQKLATVADGALHVVCHLPGPVDSALALSRQCAEQAAAGLRNGGAHAEPFGAGPLLPRPNAPQARLELVVPSAPR